jgi:ankyrin repeat protein
VAAALDALPLAERAAALTGGDGGGRSLLHWAVDGGHARVAGVLLARGAPAGARDAEGLAPLDYARLLEDEACIGLLLPLVSSSGLPELGV